MRGSSQQIPLLDTTTRFLVFPYASKQSTDTTFRNQMSVCQLFHFMSNQILKSNTSYSGVIGDLAFSPFRNITCHMGEIVSIYVSVQEMKTLFNWNLTLNHFWRKHIYVWQFDQTWKSSGVLSTIHNKFRYLNHY